MTSLNSGAISSSGTVTGSRFAGAAGDTQSAPAFTWTGDLTTGVYRPAASQVAVTIAGTQRAIITGTGLGVTGTISASSTVTGTSFIGVATSAQYADLAENYIADAAYEPGTVLEFGGEFEVTIASNESARIAGIVSTQPAYLMNSHLAGEHVVALGLLGRVPCKVLGTVKKGDMLVSAGGGFAQAKQYPATGTIIGKAIEDSTGENVIEVVVGRL